MAWPETHSQSIDPDRKVEVVGRRVPDDCTRCERAAECVSRLRAAISDLLDATGPMWQEEHPRYAILSLNEAEGQDAEAEFWDYLNAENDFRLLERYCLGGLEGYNPETNAMDNECGLPDQGEV